MVVASRRVRQSLQPILEKLRHAYFPTARFRESEPGTAIAFDGRRKMTSAFQPVVDAHDGSIQGHHALLRAADERGHPITFVRSTISYGIRGYRVLAVLHLSDAHADLEPLFLADPHYVAMDAGELVSPDGNILARVRSIVKALHSRGIQAVARRVESESQMQAARDAGFNLLQGRFFGPPSQSTRGRINPRGGPGAGGVAMTP